MNTSQSRRCFFRDSLLAGSALALSLGTANAAFPSDVPDKNRNGKASPHPGKIKVGCTSWAFHGFNAGESPKESIDLLGEMGFDSVELIVNAPQDLTDFWTDERVGAIRKQLDKYEMQVSQFALFQPVVENLSSLDKGKRNEALDLFEAGVKLARKLDALSVNIVAPWPRELQRPGGGYLPRYYDLPEPTAEQKFVLEIDDSFNWDDIWNRYVETTKACLERTKKHELRFSIEHHTHCLVSGADSFLLLWDAIRDDSLGYNLDVGWTQSQREYPPVAIHKVKKHLFNLHIRDIDGMMRRFIPFGEGVMDFAGIIAALKKIGYTGYVSLEQDKYPADMKQICRNYLARMRELVERKTTHHSNSGRGLREYALSPAL